MNNLCVCPNAFVDTQKGAVVEPESSARAFKHVQAPLLVANEQLANPLQGGVCSSYTKQLQ